MGDIPLYAGLDMHGETTTCTIKDEKGNPFRVLKVETTKEGMRKLFEKINRKQVTAVFEASRNWHYYSRLLRPHCRSLVMAHPLKLRAIASARIKTDAIDSDILCDLLRSNLIPESYMPQEDIVELRELLRYRATLSSHRARLKAQVKNILSREGKKCEIDAVAGKRARLWLKHLDLAPLNRRELDFAIERYDRICEEIKSLDVSIEREQYKYPEIDLMKSIPGISTFSALMIISEIADISRFDKPSKLAAYAGLVPSTYQSSNTAYHGKITKQGNRWLRWITTQCVHAGIKSHKSHKLKTFCLKLERKKGKQKAVVATARKMLTTIWYLLNKNEYYAYRDSTIKNGL